MDFLTDNVDEDAERVKRRKERMEKMRQEKQKQMRRRQQMKVLIPIVAFGVVVVGISFVTVAAIGKKKTENVQKDNLTVAVNTQGDNLIVEENVQTESLNTEETVQADSLETEETKFLSESEVFQKDILTQIENNQEQDSLNGEKKKEETIVYTFQPTAETVTIYNEEIISENAILVDESTGNIIASKGAKERISPASMTKVLTILVAMENITEEQLDDTFIMTREITDYGYINDCSAVGFLEGEEVTVRDLFYGTILPSGGDAAVGLATYVAGSHEAFVELMNQKLEEMQLSESTHVTNCVGVYDENHYSTVYDMSVIMKSAIENDFCKKVLAEHNYTTDSTTEHPEGINISNWFLRRIEDKDTGGEVLCAKTGYVRQSKNCAVSYGTFADGNPYICVTAGSSSSWQCIYDHVEIYTSYISA